MRSLLAIAALGLLLAACGGGDDDLADRVAALEAEVQDLQTELDQVTAPSGPIVVSNLRSEVCGGGRARVVWVIAGTEQAGCWAPDHACVTDAVVGERLPDTCR